MLNRLKNIVAFLKGEYIVLKIEEDTLVVDAGRNDVSKVKSAASVFFKKTYILS